MTPTPCWSLCHHYTPRNACLLSRDCSHSPPSQLWYVPEQDRSPDPASVAISLPSRAKQAAHDGILLFRQAQVQLENSCTPRPNAGVPSPGHWETGYNSLGKAPWSNSELSRLRSCCDGQVPLGGSASSCRSMNSSLMSVCLTCARNYIQFCNLKND